MIYWYDVWVIFFHSAFLTETPIYIFYSFLLFFFTYVCIKELSFLFTISKSVVIMFKRFIVIFRAASFDINIDDRDVRSKLMGKIAGSASRIEQPEKNELQEWKEKEIEIIIYLGILNKWNDFCIWFYFVIFAFGRAHNKRVCNMWCAQVSKRKRSFFRSRQHVKALIVEWSS